MMNGLDGLSQERLAMHLGAAREKAENLRRELDTVERQIAEYQAELARRQLEAWLQAHGEAVEA